VFVRFDVRYEGEVVEMLDKSVGSYCVSLGSLNKGGSRVLCSSRRKRKRDAWADLPFVPFPRLSGYRHLPLQDQHLNQFLFSSLFAHLNLVSSSPSSSSGSLSLSPSSQSPPRSFAHPTPISL